MQHSVGQSCRPRIIPEDTPLFQTEPILWLQSMQSEWLTLAMRTVSLIVDDTVFLVLGLVIFFGFDHRRGYAILVTLLWVGLLTAGLKAVFALPRPSDVDMRVLLLDTGSLNPTPFLGHGAGSFFSLPSHDAIASLRASNSPDFGLPSGHCSSTVAFWGTLAYLFRRKWITGASIGLILVMPLSRMYLGRHFLGDTLGGLALGGLALLCFILVMRHLQRSNPWSRGNRLILRVAGCVVLPMLPVLFGETRTFGATLVALGVVYLATDGLRVYDGEQSLFSRILFTLMAIALVAVLQSTLTGILPKPLAYALVIFSVFGATGICMRIFTSGKTLKENSQL